MASDSQNDSRQAEDDRRHPESGDAQQEIAAAPPHRRQVGEKDGHAESPCGRGGAKPAEAAGSHLQDVPGEDGKQVDGAAEQHGEHVEADRGEHQPRAPDVADTPENHGGGGGGRRAAVSLQADAAEHEDEDEGAGGGAEIGGGNRPDDYQSAGSRTQDRCQLPHAAVPGDGVVKDRPRHDLRQQGGARRASEDVGCRIEKQQGVHRLDRSLGDRQGRQPQGGEGGAGQAEQGHAAPVEAVGQVPRGKRQGHPGQRLHEADHPQGQGLAGALVHLPADGYFLNVGADGETDAAVQVAAEVGYPEGGVRIVSPGAHPLTAAHARPRPAGRTCPKAVGRRFPRLIPGRATCSTARSSRRRGSRDCCRRERRGCCGGRC